MGTGGFVVGVGRRPASNLAGGDSGGCVGVRTANGALSGGLCVGGGLHGDGGAGAGGCLNGMFRPCINDRERDRRRLSAEIVASFSQAASIA